MRRFPGNFAILLLSAVLLLLSACATTAQSAVPEDEWTVMLYVCGTDLESNYAAATTNLAELSEASAAVEGLNFVIEAGGTHNWHSEENIGIEFSSDKLGRYVYTSSGYQLVEEVESRSMAESSTLSDFISWSAENYPAKKYMLLLWDHGGGSLRGVFYDELYMGSSMSIEDFSHAMRDGGVHFDLVVFDTCLMANLELASALSPYADYLVASEEVLPGEGLAYTPWAELMRDNPSATALEIGTVMLDATAEKYSALDSFSQDILTVSLIELDKIPAVQKAFDELVLELSSKLSDPDSFRDVSYYIFHGAEQYGLSKDYYQFDLGNMAQMAELGGLSEERCSALLEAVDAAVVKMVRGEGRAKGLGISQYYGLSENKFALDHYARSASSNAFLALLDAVRYNWSAPEAVYSDVSRVPSVPRSGYVVENEIYLSEDGELILEVTNGKDSVTSVQYELYVFDDDTESLYSLGRSTNINGSFEDGIFSIYFDGTWPAIDSIPAGIEIAEESFGYNLLNIPVRYDGDTDGYLRAAYYYDSPLTGASEEDFSGHYEIFGIWTSYDSNIDTLSRNVISLDEVEGEELELMLPEARISDGLHTINSMSTGEIIAGSDLVMENSELDREADYIVRFVVTDSFGFEYLSDGAILSYDADEDEWFYLPFDMLSALDFEEAADLPAELPSSFEGIEIDGNLLFTLMLELLLQSR